MRSEVSLNTRNKLYAHAYADAIIPIRKQSHAHADAIFLRPTHAVFVRTSSPTSWQWQPKRTRPELTVFRARICVRRSCPAFFTHHFANTHADAGEHKHTHTHANARTRTQMLAHARKCLHTHANARTRTQHVHARNIWMFCTHENSHRR